MNLEALKAKIRQYPLVAIFGCLSFILIAIILIRLPKVGALNVVNEQREREWSTMRTNNERSADLTAEVEQLREYSKEVSERLISAETIANNYDYFYSIERQTGVRIINIQQLPVVSARRAQYIPQLNDYDLIPFNLTFQGGFDVTMTFLQGLERGFHLIRIESLSVGREEGPAVAAGQRTVTTRIELNILGKKASR